MSLKHGRHVVVYIHIHIFTWPLWLHSKHCWPSFIVEWCHLRFHIYILCERNHPKLNVTFLPSPGRREVGSDSLSGRWMLANRCFRSLPRFDGWTLRQLVLHSEHTRIVFAPETFPLPDRRPRELGYDPHGNVTHREIRLDGTMMWDNVTWTALLPL